MNTQSWILLVWLLFLPLSHVAADSSAEQQKVEESLRLKYTDVEYHPTFGGWYLLSSREKSQKTYSLGDSEGNIVVSGAIEYQLYDGFIRFRFVDEAQKRLHEQWEIEKRAYEVAYAKYSQAEDEYKQVLKAYNTQVEAVKLRANEQYKQEVAEAQRKAQAEYQRRQSSDEGLGGLFGGVVKAIGSAVVQASATQKISYDAILSEMLDKAGLLTPPAKPYNPTPILAVEPPSGYEWRCYSYQQPCPYSEIDYEAMIKGESIADVKQNGKYGLVNTQLEELIPCVSRNKIYQGRLADNNVLVKVNGKYGVCSERGDVLVRFAYDSIGLSSDVFVARLSNGSSGLIAYDGQELFPFVAYEIVELAPGYILVSDKQDRYGAINYEGKMIVPVKNKREQVEKKVAMYAKKSPLADENLLALERVKHAYNAYLAREAEVMLARGKHTKSQEKMLLGSSDVDIQIPVTSKKEENTFVVIIANKNYDEAPNVEYALNDGYMFKEYCLKTLGVPEGNIRLKEDATYNHMREAVNWIREIGSNKVYKDKAKFIVYYSGHGVPDEMSRSMYLLPKDGVAMNIAHTGYRISDLYDVLAESGAESVVLLDACFSGFDKSGLALASTKGVVKVVSGAPKGNTVVLSASAGNEVAHQYEEKSHGLFTYYLLKKLQESQGDVTLGELFGYIEKQVARTSLTVIKKSQTPSVAAGAEAQAWEDRKL